MQNALRKIPEVHCYLAGPDVFYPDAIARGAQKKDKVATLGMHGHFPFDNEFPKELFQGDGANASMVIAEENEKMMARCIDDGNIGVIMINMTPWRGVEMDTGTAFEAGFFSHMKRMGKPVILVGYYDQSTPTFFERVASWCLEKFGVAPKQDALGFWRDGEGNAIENFGKNRDNLMIDEAIRRTGGHVCFSFDEAAQLAKKLSDEMKHALASETPKFSPLYNVTVQGSLGALPHIASLAQRA